MSRDFYEFFCPVKVIAGVRALEHIPFELGLLGAARPMILTDKGVIAAGLLNHVQKALASSGVTAGAVFDDVPQDSSLATVRAAAARYREAGCDAILAVGGGSVIDTSKGVNILVSDAGDVADGGGDLLRYAGAHHLKKPLRPLFVVPTTAGTGSEVTLVAIISDESRGVKVPFTSTFLMPNAAILDPRMTQTLPPHLTAMTAMDAMTHAMEAFTCMAANPLSDAYATSAIKKISQHLIPVLDHPTEPLGRLELAQASTMAGIAFSNSMVGLVHALGHTLGSMVHLPHGLCMNLFLPYVLEYNLPVASDRIGELLLPLAGPEIYASTPKARRGAETIVQLRRLRDTLHARCKLPRTLAETGKLERTALRTLAERALDDGPIAFNPREVNLEDMIGIVERAWG